MLQQGMAVQSAAILGWAVARGFLWLREWWEARSASTERPASGQ